MLHVPEKWFSVQGIYSKKSSLIPFVRPIRLLALLLTLSALGGCASFATSRLADNLSGAILNQDDPETVKTGMPAYLILVDSLIDGDPKNEKLLLTGSKLYGAYAAAFIKEPERARRLTRKARDYADRALCRHDKHLCNLLEQTFDDFSANIGTLNARDVPVLFAAAAAWAGWIQANSSNWDAIASLPKVKSMMARVAALDETYSHGEAHLYLGVIDTLLPPALGGKPEEGRAHFERAISISAGRDLMDKVEYARHYARITYNRPLHDRLLHEVLDADAVAPDLTLSNMLAKQQARELLASADSYF
jgi:TRAP transporter T-component